MGPIRGLPWDSYTDPRKRISIFLWGSRSHLKMLKAISPTTWVVSMVGSWDNNPVKSQWKRGNGEERKKKGGGEWTLFLILDADSQLPPFFLPLCNVPYSPFKDCKQLNSFSGLMFIGSMYCYVLLATEITWFLYIFFSPVDVKSLGDKDKVPFTLHPQGLAQRSHQLSHWMKFLES